MKFLRRNPIIAYLTPLGAAHVPFGAGREALWLVLVFSACNLPGALLMTFDPLALPVLVILVALGLGPFLAAWSAARFVAYGLGFVQYDLLRLSALRRMARLGGLALVVLFRLRLLVLFASGIVLALLLPAGAMLLVDPLAGLLLILILMLLWSLPLLAAVFSIALVEAWRAAGAAGLASGAVTFGAAWLLLYMWLLILQTALPAFQALFSG